MKNIIFFQPAPQHDNTGDVLINRVLLDIIKELGKLIVDDKNKPVWFLDEIGITEDNYLSKISTDPLMKVVGKFLDDKKADENIYLIIPPGHTSRKGRLSAMYGDHGFIHTNELLKLKSRGLKIMRFGFSIGPFDILNTLAESYYTRVFKSYCVRDSQSLALAKKFFFKSPELMPDLAWAFMPPVNRSSDNNYIALSFRSNKFGTKHDTEYLKPILDNIKKLVTTTKLSQYPIKVVYQVEFDREPSKEIYEALKDIKADVVLVDEKLNLQEAVDMYANAKYVISNRLHVIMLGVIANTVSIPLIIEEDNQKITSIFNDNALSNYILNVYKPEEFISKVDDFEANAEACKNEIANVVKKNRIKVQHQVESAFN